MEDAAIEHEHAVGRHVRVHGPADAQGRQFAAHILWQFGHGHHAARCIAQRGVHVQGRWAWRCARWCAGVRPTRRIAAGGLRGGVFLRHAPVAWRCKPRWRHDLRLREGRWWRHGHRGWCHRRGRDCRCGGHRRCDHWRSTVRIGGRGWLWLSLQPPHACQQHQTRGHAAHGPLQAHRSADRPLAAAVGRVGGMAVLRVQAGHAFALAFRVGFFQGIQDVGHGRTSGIGQVRSPAQRRGGLGRSAAGAGTLCTRRGSGTSLARLISMKVVAPATPSGLRP